MSLLSLNCNIRGDRIIATHTDCVKSGVKSLTILGFERGSTYLLSLITQQVSPFVLVNVQMEYYVFFSLQKTSKNPVHIS